MSRLGGMPLETAGILLEIHSKVTYGMVNPVPGKSERFFVIFETRAGHAITATAKKSE